MQILVRHETVIRLEDLWLQFDDEILEAMVAEGHSTEEEILRIYNFHHNFNMSYGYDREYPNDVIFEKEELTELNEFLQFCGWLERVLKEKNGSNL